MKKLLLILVLFLSFTGYYIYTKSINTKEEIIKLTLEEQTIDIDKLYVYGTHLNIEGSNLPTENLELVLYNKDIISIPITISNDKFYISNKVNDGYYLDDLKIGSYYLLLREKNTENDQENYKYYGLSNKTDYKETTYYTLSNTNKKIIIKDDSEYSTLLFEVTKNTNNDIYDIVLDPGHGGMDGGAERYGYKETDFNLTLAIKIKETLEKEGMKVKLTREDNLTSNTKLPTYGQNGRTAIPGNVKAKYLFSLHMNSNSSTSSHGLEIYTPYNINYDFARLLASNIKNETGLSYSNNKVNRVEEGLYTRTFTKEGIESYREELIADGDTPYDITTSTNYYYIIRETGGIVTGAYVDGRNGDYNPYTNSNTGTESYILELGYITNKDDINNIKNNMDKYASSISTSILTLYK